jgi:hypothetical protein
MSPAEKAGGTLKLRIPSQITDLFANRSLPQFAHPALFTPGLDAATAREVGDERKHKQHQEDKKYQFRNARCHNGHAGKAQDSGDQCHYQKY